MGDGEEMRVLSVQSWVVHGYVGNRAALVPLTLAGIETDVVNTVQLSAHTGYPHHNGSVLNDQDLGLLMKDLHSNAFAPSYTHLLAGYVGSTTALEELARAGKLLKQVSPRLRFFIDPVLGDDGKFYVPQANVGVYAKDFLPMATTVTPNQFELEQLSGRAVASEDEIWDAVRTLHKLGPATVVVTSSHLGPQNMITGFASSTASSPPLRLRFSVPKLPYRFVGTGDVFSVLLLINMEKEGRGLEEALGRTLGSLQALLARTVEQAKKQTEPNSPAALELRLVQNPQLITNPTPHPITRLD